MNILIVDDEPLDRKLLRAKLEPAGHVILEAADGLQALELLDREKVDLIISDVLMPRMDGYRLCHDVRASERFHHLPFIIHTASYTLPADRKLCLDLGTDHYLQKPASPPELMAALTEATAAAHPTPAASPMEADVLQEYSARLVTKLEQTNSELQLRTEQMRATQERLHHLLAHCPAVLYTLKIEHGNLVPSVVSANIERVLGVPADETDFVWWRDSLHPEDRARVLFTVAQALEGTERTLSYRLRHRDGTYRWVEDHQRTIRDADGTPTEIVGVWSDISPRKKAELELEQTHLQMVALSRQAGRAELANGILHNVGNVLNSVNVASNCLAESLKKSKASNLAKVVALMRQHEADLGSFFMHDPKGKQVPGYLAHLADHLAEEQTAALKELGDLQQSIEHIKRIVRMQQDSAKRLSLPEDFRPADLVEEALKLNANSLTHHKMQVARDFAEIPTIKADRHQVMQILVNLIQNALQAVDDSATRARILTLRLTENAGRICFSVADTGTGISSENLGRIFSHGFTTKKDGHGFGLHSAALAAQEMGGRLSVHSDGPGTGATFTLELPLVPPVETAAR